MRRPSQTLTRMPRSGIREIFDLAHGIPDAIHLEVGEPDFPTPEHICQAAAEAAFAGFTHYTPNAGIPELREAIVGKLLERNDVDVEVDRVVVTTGAGGGLFTAIRALTDPGDGVLIPDPSWPNYAMMATVQELDVQYFPLRPEDGLVPTPEHIEPHLTERSRVLLVNSPGNPTGVVIHPETMRQLVDFAEANDLWLISDEVYDEMTFGRDHISALTMVPNGHVIGAFSFSKTYAMTGWRVGYVVATPEVASLITKCQEPISSCVNSPAQKAAVAALTGPQDAVAEMRSAYRERRDRATEILDAAGLPHAMPEGAFYLWVDVSGTGMSDIDFARKLVLDRQVAVVPGTAFGPTSGAYIRISLASALDDLVEGVRRTVAAVQEWAS